MHEATRQHLNREGQRDDKHAGNNTGPGAAGYGIVLSAATSTRFEQDALDLLMADRCEGVALIGSRLSNKKLRELSKRYPVMLVNRASTAAIAPAISDDGVAMAIAIEHPVGLGHSRIAYVDGARGPVASVRKNAYRRAMADHGLSHLVHVIPGGSASEDGAAAADILASDPYAATAVCCFNDLLAVGMLLAFRETGLCVPGDLSLVGYDDNPLASVRGIELTIIRQDTGNIASAAATRLIDRVEGRGPTNHSQYLPVELMVRKTTDAPA